jgi:CheY-like chemotaxis protein
MAPLRTAMLINNGWDSSQDMSLILQPVWTALPSADPARIFGAAFSEKASDEKTGVNDFLRLTEVARAALAAGHNGATGLIRVRAGTRFFNDPGLAKPGSNAGAGEEYTALRHQAGLTELNGFLASRLNPASSAWQIGGRVPATALYGAYTLLVWQTDCTADELSTLLNICREEYRFLKQSDFVAGIAAAPEAASDLPGLIALADEALTEAYSARQIICFRPVPSNAAGSQMLSRPTLLIVDDNHDQVEILDLIMRQKGYQTLRAYNGAQALEVVRNCNPDLLLLDVGMPQLDGFDVMSRLRDLNGGKLELPVIMITGSDTEESVLRGFELGARDYVIKPWDPHDLLSRIRTILSTSYRQ